jgi:hypothetical protein
MGPPTSPLQDPSGHHHILHFAIPKPLALHPRGQPPVFLGHLRPLSCAACMRSPLVCFCLRRRCGACGVAGISSDPGNIATHRQPTTSHFREQTTRGSCLAIARACKGGPGVLSWGSCSRGATLRPLRFRPTPFPQRSRQAQTKPQAGSFTCGVDRSVLEQLHTNPLAGRDAAFLLTQVATRRVDLQHTPRLAIQRSVLTICSTR